MLDALSQIAYAPYYSLVVRPRAGRISGAEHWALAAGGIPARVHGAGVETLHYGCAATRARGLLSQSWRVGGAAAVEEVLRGLWEDGHRSELRALLGQLGDITAESRAALEAHLPPGLRARARFAIDNRRIFKNDDLIGWDMGRFIDVVRLSFTAGYLPEERAWSLVLDAAERIQGAYASWEELSVNYIAGARYAEGGAAPDPFLLGCAQWLLQSPGSPVRRLRWNTPLHPEGTGPREGRA